MTKDQKRRNVGLFGGEVSVGALRSIGAVISLAATFFFIFAAFGKAGFAGNALYRGLTGVFGISYILIPLATLMGGVRLLRPAGTPLVSRRGAAGGTILILAVLGLTHLTFPGKSGYVGGWLTAPLLNFFDVYPTIIFLGAAAIIGLFILFDTTFPLPPVRTFWESLRTMFRKRREEFSITNAAYTVAQHEEPKEMEEKNSAHAVTHTVEEELPVLFSKKAAVSPRGIGRRYTPPPFALLERDQEKPVVGDIKANVNIIKRTLQNFDIHVEMDEVVIGPSVTRYALKPAEGIKLSKIVGLQNDLALALAAHPIRIEAPIPGKSLVGIEVPNMVRATVGLGNLLGSEEFQTSSEPLLFPTGKSISGKTYFANLAKMPHLLIAGATGSGKSVGIHTIITSLLFRNSPEHLRFILIDPKRVELTLYNKIPHLLTPVITDAKKAILALKWAAKEMERRYDILESEAVRDIESYHKRVVEPAARRRRGGTNDDGRLPDLLPYLTIVIDELADIMATYPRELEAAIVRLAQMSRAVGIHLILSTQRPSVNIITGLIKVNIPTRIALQVSSQIDSRTILDSGGAEKLLGAGDLLFLSADMPKPVRLQGAYVSEEEVKKVVSYLIEHNREEADEELAFSTELAVGTSSPLTAPFDEDAETEDDLYETARAAVLEAGKASTSYLQRKLRIGYGRAARLMDILEERGIIGPPDGSKPRVVIGVVPSSRTREEHLGEEP